MAATGAPAPIDLPAAVRPELAGIVDSSTREEASQSWLTSANTATDTSVDTQMRADWPKGRCVRIDSIRMPGLQLISKRLETRVSAMVQPHARQCVDPERLDALTQRINEVLQVDGKPEAVAELPDRPIVNGVLTLRFRDAAMAARRTRPSNGGTTIQLRSAASVQKAEQEETVKIRSMPVYGFGRWTDNTQRAASNTVPVAPVASPERNTVPKVVLQRVQNHWLASHLQLAGNSAQSNDGHHGRIGVAANGLVQADHDMRLDFNESASQRVENESETFAFSYSFPLGANRFSLYANNYEYQSTVVGDDGKYEASGEGRNINVSSRRALFSWAGIAFDSVLSLSSSDARYFERGQWIEDSSRQLSKFTLEGATHNDLWFDILSTTRISASSGLEVLGKNYDMEESLDENERFNKFSVSSTLSRELFNWQWGVTGRYQFTPGELPGSEYLLVAGPSMIAGFNGQTLAAAEGGWLRLDASSPSFTVPMMPNLRSDVRLSVLQGWVPYDSLQADRFGSASAAEISLQLQARGLRADVSVGRMLGSSSLATRKPDLPDVSFSLSVGL
ncbi:ShlB/FhaC/HecB family hemolysin secretion/activation protein [Marinobacter fonticola]|uniref:ShlB/FhaC/HecB family hemolysin secretion/activation protein n=1 Tax=Marinobacter fonticola TaxID=2603215 RepID=UPI0011E76D5B|nr:ShlB/FhaC/HecB family hemolysin secretion/activation protein [Marinobacter fonticola]